MKLTRRELIRSGAVLATAYFCPRARGARWPAGAGKVLVAISCAARRSAEPGRAGLDATYTRGADTRSRRGPSCSSEAATRTASASSSADAVKQMYDQGELLAIPLAAARIRAARTSTRRTS